MLVGEVPAEGDGGKNGTEKDGAKAGEENSESEPGDGGACGGVVGVVSGCWHGLWVASFVMLPRGRDGDGKAKACAEAAE